MSDIDDLADRFGEGLMRRRTYRGRLLRNNSKPQCEALNTKNYRCQKSAAYKRDGRNVCLTHSVGYLPVTFVKLDGPRQ